MSDRVSRMRVPFFDTQLAYVSEAIRRGHLALGPHQEILAEELGRLFSKRFVTLTSSGFGALLVTLRAVTTPGESVFTSPASTCFAMVNAIRAAGLRARYVDMEPGTMSIPLPCPSEQCAGGGTALIPDHFGVVAQAVRDQARSNGIVVEDAAQAFVSRIDCPTIADVVVLSFYPTKVANGIDGGAVLTDDPGVQAAVQRAASYEDQREPDPAVRFNLRMSNINAAFLLGTLEHLTQLRVTLDSTFKRLESATRAAGLDPLTAGGDSPSRFVVRVADGESRDRLLAKLNRRGIDAARELVPVCPPEDWARLPIMQRLVSTTLSLPFHAALMEWEIEHMERVLGSL